MCCHAGILWMWLKSIISSKVLKGKLRLPWRWRSVTYDQLLQLIPRSSNLPLLTSWPTDFRLAQTVPILCKAISWSKSLNIYLLLVLFLWVNADRYRKGGGNLKYIVFCFFQTIFSKNISKHICLPIWGSSEDEFLDATPKNKFLFMKNWPSKKIREVWQLNFIKKQMKGNSFEDFWNCFFHGFFERTLK